MLELNPLKYQACLIMPGRLTPFSAWHEHIPFAMFLVDLVRPSIIVELGTQYGDSYCAFCQAVSYLNLDTRCYAIDTWQGDPHAGYYGPEVLADLREYHDPLYGNFSRLVHSTFDEALQHFTKGTIDILHIDGYHIHESVKHDFESWLPKMSSRGIVLLHDTNVRERDFGARAFWDVIKLQYPHFEFLHCHGLGVLAVGQVYSEEMQALLHATGDGAVRIRDFFFELGHRLAIKRRIESVARELEIQKKQLTVLDNNLQERVARISELDIVLQTKEAQIEDLEGSLEGETARIQVLEASIEERDAQTRTLEAALEERDAEIRTLEAALEERDAQTRTLEAALEERDAQTPVLEAALEERDAQTHALEASLEKKTAEIRALEVGLEGEIAHARALGISLEGEIAHARELGASLEKKTTQAQALEAELEKKGTQAQALEAELEEKGTQAQALEAELEEKGTQVKVLQVELEGKTSQIATVCGELDSIKRSLVWRSTMKFDSFIAHLFPLQSKRRSVYELGPSVIRTIINEGWRSFFRKVKVQLRPNKPVSSGTIYNATELKAPMEPIPASLEKEAKRVVFPKPSEEPEVSIIIPAYNKWEYTVSCLKSIFENTSGDYEVIVVDDNSSDQTGKVLSKIKNLRLVTNTGNFGFVESCNRGAKVSTGKYILFLNNDTVVTENWLLPLLEIIGREDVGAVGSKFVYPNGILQEAGSIVWSDGSALGYGRGDQSDKPEYEYVREVDYCSGASLLVERGLFEQTGGFDERFKPGYYEDTDLCLTIKDLGYKVIYQPRSVVIHFEGITSGTDISSGIKQYQEINKPKFVAKWNDTLQKHHLPPGRDNVFLARNRVRGENVLVLDDRIPTSKQGSGFPRANSMLKFLGELGYKVTFFPLQDTTPYQPYTGELQQLGIEVFYGENLDFMRFAEDRAGCYDLIVVSRPHNMKQALDTINTYFSEAVLIYDAEALFSLREILKAEVKGTRLKEKDAERMINEEIDLVKKAGLVITVSENEKAIVSNKTQLDNIAVWGHAVEVNEPQAPFDQRKDILFVGAFLTRDSPNEDAITYFVEDVFPEIEKELRCQLFVVGMDPFDSVKKLGSSSITVAGYVEDIRGYYERSRIFIVPHRYSAGIPWKLHEAMSNGIPCVVSEITASQLDLTDGKEVLVARTSEEFTQKIIGLYRDEELWYEIQSNALKLVREDCNPEAMKKSLDQVIRRGLGVWEASRERGGAPVSKQP